MLNVHTATSTMPMWMRRRGDSAPSVAFTGGVRAAAAAGNTNLVASPAPPPALRAAVDHGYTALWAAAELFSTMAAHGAVGLNSTPVGMQPTAKMEKPVASGAAAISDT